MEKVLEIAKMIDHSLLHPTLTDEELREGCELAKKYNVASVCIKPYAIKLAAGILKGSDVLVGTVIGFPHGNNKIEVKVYEAESACKDGAVELDIVVNIGRVLSEDWDYIEKEIKAVDDVARKYNAIIKVIFENDFLPDDKYKIKLCEICSKLKVAFVKTSTGYGFVKGEDNKYFYKGATDHDLRLMRKYCSSAVKIKAAGGLRTLNDVLRVKEIGVTRVGATATETILLEAKKRFNE
ncbi:MAG: deoxyribose-phosphate aldolase [Candidatus Aminicenantes bacterium]|nr:deoxyribose-phosphate aldolase [Candidatus Aminicenantes bacterium]